MMFTVIVDDTLPMPESSIYWNPYNKVVQDHRDGTIDHKLTNQEREKRNLPTPWTPAIGNIEVYQPPIF